MQHPINPLNAAGLDMLCERLTDFTVAYENLSLDGCMERVERILPLDLFNELRAYLGSMRDHVSVVTELLYGDQQLLVNDGLVTPVASSVKQPECPICDPESPDACNPNSYFVDDHCPPQGITRPAWIQHTQATERIAAQLQRGVITRDEFEAAMAAINAEYGHLQGGAPALSPEGTVG